MGAHTCFNFVLQATQDGLPLAAKDMHPSFENLIVIGAQGLHASLMDFNHNTSFRYILEDDFISLTSRACICICSGKGARLCWLLGHLFVCFASHTLFSP
jgi:hypothetical protein